MDRRLRATEVTSPEIEDVADRLLYAGIRDYFDRLVCATAAVKDAVFLTEDEELLNLDTNVSLPKPAKIARLREAIMSIG